MQATSSAHPTLFLFPSPLSLHLQLLHTGIWMHASSFTNHLKIPSASEWLFRLTFYKNARELIMQCGLLIKTQSTEKSTTSTWITGVSLDHINKREKRKPYSIQLLEQRMACEHQFHEREVSRHDRMLITLARRVSCWFEASWQRRSHCD